MTDTEENDIARARRAVQFMGEEADCFLAAWTGFGPKEQALKHASHAIQWALTAHVERQDN